MAISKSEKTSLDQILTQVDRLTPGMRKKLEREIKLQELRREIQKGIDLLERGEGIPADEVFRELKKRNVKARKHKK